MKIWKDIAKTMLFKRCDTRGREFWFAYVITYQFLTYQKKFRNWILFSDFQCRKLCIIIYLFIYLLFLNAYLLILQSTSKISTLFNISKYVHRMHFCVKYKPLWELGQYWGFFFLSSGGRALYYKICLYTEIYTNVNPR